MIIENTKEMRQIQNVAATMAVEDMPISKKMVEELIKISKGEKTHEELRQEIIKKHAR